MDPATLGGLLAGSVVAIAIAAFKLIERMESRRNGSNGRADAIWELLARVDSEGTPMIYFPRRAARLLEKIAEDTKGEAFQLRRLVAAHEKLLAESTRQTNALHARLKELEGERAELREIRRALKAVLDLWAT